MKTKETVGDIEVWGGNGYECKDCMFCDDKCGASPYSKNSREYERSVIFEPVNENNSDNLSHPSHYTDVLIDMEVIKLIALSSTLGEFRGYCRGCQIKYHMRAGKKDDIAQEISKSDEYGKLFEEFKQFCHKSDKD